MGPAPEPASAPRCQAGPSESELPSENMEELEEEQRRRTLNTSQDTGNTTNNPDNNITSRTLEGSLEL